MRRRSYTRRARARLRNRPGQRRWAIVDKATGKVSGLHTSYPDQATAERFCGLNEEPKKVTVVEAAGPFSDHVEAT